MLVRLTGDSKLAVGVDVRVCSDGLVTCPGCALLLTQLNTPK